MAGGVGGAAIACSRVHGRLSAVDYKPSERVKNHETVQVAAKAADLGGPAIMIGTAAKWATVTDGSWPWAIVDEAYQMRSDALLREAVAEYLLPPLGGFFVYAQPRGEFVLGGLEAVFETVLHRLFAVVLGEARCPPDPACLNKGGAACPACLHLGEPACRYFNRYLSRSSLFADDGYLQATPANRRRG